MLLLLLDLCLVRQGKILCWKAFSNASVHEAFRKLGHVPCADPGIFVRGVQISLIKKALTTFFFFFIFSPQLILQKSNGQFQRNLSFFKVPEGVQHFPGGGGSNFFQGGPIAYSL